MKPIQIISQDLFDKVRSRFTNLEMGDETGSVTIDPADARFFDFDFVSEGTNLGRVSISINDGGSLKVYYSQGITENQDTPVKKEWFGFLREMRLFAMRRLLRFDTRDIAKTNLDKNDFQHLAQTQGPKEPEDMTTMNESKKKKQGVAEGKANNDLRDNVLAVLTNIYNGSVAGEYMIDDIADELNDYFDQVQQSNDPILQKAYSFMVDNGQEAEENPKLMARIAQKAISLLSQQGVAEGDQLRGREGAARINKKPRDGQTDLGNIPVGNRPNNSFTDAERKQHPERVKHLIKQSLGKHPNPNLPESGVAEDRTETKNDQGEVTAWRDETPWTKSTDKKNPRGRVTNLSDRARRETEKLNKQPTVAEVTGDLEFDNKLKKITSKTAVTRQQKADRRAEKADNQARAKNAFGNMFGGDDPVGNLKIREQGVAESGGQWVVVYGSEEKVIDGPFNSEQEALNSLSPREKEDPQVQVKQTMGKGLQESRWSPKSSAKTSRAVRGATEVIVRHAKRVEETFPGARSQRKNIKAIFIQNRDGERFKYPFIHPAGAFAMAQHVDHGGVPHDPAGKAIVRMSEEIAQLAQFENTIRKATLHDDAMGITERAIGRLSELKATIEALGKRHHYENWINEFTADESMDSMGELDAVTMEQYKEKFTQTNFQEELTGYFPLLHRIMGEANKIDLEQYVSEDVSSEFTVCANDGTYEIEKFPSLDDAMEYIEASFRDDPDSRQMDYSIKDSTGNTVWTHDEDHDLGYDAYKERGWSQEGAFEEWAEAVEQGKLTDNQIELLKKAIAQQEQAGQPLQLGPNGQTAWDFFTGAINPDDAEGSAGAEFGDSLKDKLAVAAREFPDTDPMEVFQTWANQDYPELSVALGMSGEEEPAQEPETAPAPPEEQPAKENEEMGGKPNELMTKEGMIKEVAKIVKSFYNRDNPDVGPFRGEENIALDVKKSISEKFGDEAGEQAEQMAAMFMEKLSQDWAQRHGKVGDDGLARLKELLGNLKGKVESIGDRGNSTTDFNTNIMSAEENEKEKPKQPNPYPVGSDAMKGKVIPALDKSRSFFGKTYEELDVIRKLSGLAK